MRTCLAALVGILAVSSAVFAQDTQPKFEVAAGYSLLMSAVPSSALVTPTTLLLSPGKQGNHGADVQFAYNATPIIGFIFDVSGHHGSANFESITASPTSLIQNATSSGYTKQDDMILMVGPRLNHSSGRLRLFAQMAVGAAQIRQSASSTSTSSISISTVGVLGSTLVSNTTTATQNSVNTLTMKGTNFAFAAGAGMDWTYGRWALRMIHVNYLHTGGTVRLSSVTDSSCVQTNGTSCGLSNSSLTSTTKRQGNDLWIGAGVVFRFGKR